MKFRYLFIIVSILLCFDTFNVNASNINYNLRIDKNLHFYETITYNIEQKDIKRDDNHNFLTSIVDDPVYFDLKEENRYKKSKTKTDKGYLVTLKHDYSYLFLPRSRIINECFVNKNYNNTKRELSFEGSDFYCAHRADTIKVSINTDLDVSYSNASSSNNNAYVWNNISNNFSIKFRVRKPTIETEPMDDITETEQNEQTEKPISTKENNKKSVNGYVLVSIISLAFVIIVIGIIFLKRKKDKLDTL